MVVYKLELTIIARKCISASFASLMRYDRKEKIIFSTIFRKKYGKLRY